MSKTISNDALRLPVEILYKHEIEALLEEDKKEDKPAGWQLSPKAVFKFIVGGKAGKTEVSPKYIGHNRLVEICIATLLTYRSLLLIGEPGTAKSWLSENFVN